MSHETLRKIRIVVPVYNSASVLPHLYAQFEQFIESRSNEQYEIIFVDDSSPDGAWDAISDLCAKNPTLVRGIRMSRNYGQQPATLAGMAKAKGDLVITMDDDLQHRPEDISALIKAYDSHDNNHIVIAQFNEKKTTGIRKVLSNLNRQITTLVLNKPKNLHLSSFRLFDKFASDQIVNIKTAYPYMPALMLSVTREIVNVPLEHQDRHSGKSNYGILDILRLSSRLLINNSTVLLDIIATFGVFISLLSFLAIIAIVGLKLTGVYYTPGWASVIGSIYLIGGLILFLLGIVGKYLQRILVEITNTSNYIIEEEI